MSSIITVGGTTAGNGKPPSQHLREVYKATSLGSGTHEVVTSPVPAGYQWVIERMSVVSNSVAVPTVRIYIGSAEDYNVEDGTGNGNFDVSEYINGLLIPTGQVLRIRWINADVSAICHAKIQYWLHSL